MMFRKLYWVTERVDRTGEGRVLGVFTSIPNLIRHGLECEIDLRHLRLTLTKLDCGDGPIASWFGPTFACLERDLAQFVATDDFSSDQCMALVDLIEAKRNPTASVR
jgi:hypothetical protein